MLSKVCLEFDVKFRWGCLYSDTLMSASVMYVFVIVKVAAGPSRVSASKLDSWSGFGNDPVTRIMTSDFSSETLKSLRF